MAKPKAVPSDDSRESPAFWRRYLQASDKRRMRINEQFAMFARWDAGDLSGLVDPSLKTDSSDYRWRMSLENQISVATNASMADLMLRWPRFTVKTPYVTPAPPPPMPGMPPQPVAPQTQLFSPELARCEQTYINHTVQRVKLRAKARRSVRDLLLGGLGILKTTIDPDMAINQETLAAARAEAEEEMRNFLASGAKLYARDDQIHSAHIEVKSRYAAGAERGEVALTPAAVKYLRRHIRMHEAMKDSERPLETIRSTEIRLRRVNPLDFFYDPTATDRDECMWKGCRFLMRKLDVLSNETFDPEAREQVNTTTDRWQTTSRFFAPVVWTPGTYDIPDEMVMVYEVFDFVDQKRILYSENATLPLLYEDRGDLATLQPSGPFTEFVFTEDTMEGFGIAPPSSFAGEQAALTHIQSATVAAAIQSQARTFYDKRAIDPQEMQQLWTSPVGSAIGIDKKTPPEVPLDASIAQVPAAEVPKQNLDIAMMLTQGIRVRSGLGVAKMGGGETSPTATGAALGSEASAGISEDRGSSCDEGLQDVGRHIARLTRRFTPKAQIVAVCGPVAIEAWPEPPQPGMACFALEDAANDIAIELIPGSTRRNNTNVDQKQLLDGLTGMAADPAMQGPKAVVLRTAAWRQFMENGGATGLPWDGVEEEAQQFAMMTQMMGQQGAGGAPPGDAGGGANPSRDDENAGVAQNDMEQGAQNVGGGRVGTGASIGDRVRLVRGAATGKVATRGA